MSAIRRWFRCRRLLREAVALEKEARRMRAGFARLLSEHGGPLAVLGIASAMAAVLVAQSAPEPWRAACAQVRDLLLRGDEQLAADLEDQARVLRHEAALLTEFGGRSS